MRSNTTIVILLFLPLIIMSSDNLDYVKWKCDINGAPGLSNPLIVEDLLIISADVPGGFKPGNLFAIDRENGQAFGTLPCYRGTIPIYYKNCLYFGEHPRNFVKFDVKGETICWRVTTGSWVISEPIMCDSLNICFACADSLIYMVDDNSGEVLWTFQTNCENFRYPAFGNNTVLYPCSDGYLYALNSKNGIELWKRKFPEKLSTPLIHDDIIYIGCGDYYLYSINLISNDVIWKTSIKGGFWHRPVYFDGKLYVGSTTGYLYCIDSINGEQVWLTKVEGTIQSSPVVYKNDIFFTSSTRLNGNLYVVNSKDGSNRWKFDCGYVIFSSPTIMDNIAFIANQAFEVYAVNIGHLYENIE